MTDLLNLIVLIVIFGVVMWLINAYIPMPGGIKSLLNIVVLIVLVVYVLQFFGVVKTSLPTIRFFR